MKVRLTEKGLQVLGLKPGRKIVNVPTDRAFLLMSEGLANKDDGFMSLYRQNQPKMSTASKKAETEAPKKAETKPKKEKATSKKAAGREKAVK